MIVYQRSTLWKINGWNLQITHEKKGTWSSRPPWFCSMWIFRCVSCLHVVSLLPMGCFQLVGETVTTTPFSFSRPVEPDCGSKCHLGHNRADFCSYPHQTGSFLDNHRLKSAPFLMGCMLYCYVFLEGILLLEAPERFVVCRYIFLF